MLSVPSYYFRKDTSFRLRNVDKTKSMVINGKKKNSAINGEPEPEPRRQGRRKQTSCT